MLLEVEAISVVEVALGGVGGVRIGKGPAVETATVSQKVLSLLFLFERLLVCL